MKKVQYPKHVIGEHIVPFQLTFHKDDTVKKVFSVIGKKIKSWPNTESIYVVDRQNKLIGAVEFIKLLASDSNQILEKIMNKNFVSLTDHSHQESAVKLAIKKGVESIPVVDQDRHFLGIIDAEQIFKIMHEEHVERLMHFSGILNNEALVLNYKSKVWAVVKSRLPWLLLGLAGGIASTLIVDKFSQILETELTLAFFIPVIVYMNDAVGTQTQTIFVRYSALEKIVFIKSLLQETKAAILIGAVLSSTIFAFSAVWLNMKVAAIVSLSMFLGIVSSAIIGTSIPWFLQRLGKDPAIGSGPFTTILQDLLSIFIYFSIASIIL
ncbi:hypothetical protein A2892_00925 [Candidatus Woesebacteria bacterium RIFCSPLOWO2_01_FULL_39_10b]|uniref:CBS domain-containing protein n=1 Tax=Candidatus Woesebacteria bacterium RIFCSPLOWO2_01_FULL_39_10b TaxID=1802517 RepID=A0A1F8B751_9BACT|nr:MAG: hypothetical protein A2892_00925 [Candidatus Woesebacteria bacterium RIFCSPLOWO2_01_FULL_39_10b]